MASSRGRPGHRERVTALSPFTKVREELGDGSEGESRRDRIATGAGHSISAAPHVTLLVLYTLAAGIPTLLPEEKDQTGDGPNQTQDPDGQTCLRTRGDPRGLGNSGR